MSQYNFAASSTVTALSAAASQASTVTGSAVDVRQYDAPLLITQNHGAGTGTLDGKLQDSADGSTGWADVPGATFTQSTTGPDIKSLAINPQTTRGFIRYVGTIVTGPHLLAVDMAGVKKSV